MTGRRPAAKAPAAEGGFALVAVLLVLAIVGILGAEFAYSMRLEARAALTYKESVLGLHLAEAAVQNAVRELVGQGSRAALAEDGLLTFYTTGNVAVARLSREKIPYGGGHYSYRITDEAARLNVNNTTTAASLLTLDRLLQSLGVEKIERDIISDSLQDWRDSNDSYRLNGAESDDYYLKLGVPYRARNGNLQSINELLQIKGITPVLFRGTPERAGLAELVTVATPNPGAVNINTASRTVLAALGLAEAEILEIVATRQEVPYATVPARFSRPGLAAVSTTYRIEAEGIVDGKVRARLTAIVRKGGDRSNPSVSILDWWARR